MKDHRYTVFCHLDIKLDPVTFLHRPADRRQGIFRMCGSVLMQSPMRKKTCLKSGFIGFTDHPGHNRINISTGKRGSA